MTGAHRILLDGTRLVGRAWSGAMPTGIDRVCDAYRAHYADKALAVLQVRGRARVLSRDQSRQLFDMLSDRPLRFRARFAALAAQVGKRGAGWRDFAGGLYLNVSHTDFDLDSHQAWVEQSGVRPVYMVHDLIPIEHPDVTTPHKAARHRGRVLKALRTGSGIIANSHVTAGALKAFAGREGLTPPPLLTAPLGAPDLARPDHRTAAKAPRFVCVGTIEPRKNHLLLLDVWQRLIAELGEDTPRLELIGRWGVASDAVRRRLAGDPRLTRFVTVHTACSDQDIALRLEQSLALLAPSRAEGFGLTVVEALKIGVPVIASDLPSFREGGSDIPTYLAPEGADDWHRTIISFLRDGPELRRQLAALPHYRAPTWDDHFAVVDAWLRHLPLQQRFVPASRQLTGVPTAVYGLRSAG